MRCKHERVSIEEQGFACTVHDREKDGEWSHHSNLGYYTGTLFVKCHDCGFSHVYRRKLPKWLSARISEYL